jgi:hypothetical protein
MEKGRRWQNNHCLPFHLSSKGQQTIQVSRHSDDHLESQQSFGHNNEMKVSKDRTQKDPLSVVF